MKKVLITEKFPEKLHSLWKSFIYNPPDGYRYYDLKGQIIQKKSKNNVDSTKIINKETSIQDKSFQFLVQFFFKNLKNVYMNQLLKEFLCKRRSKKIYELKPDIVYCINGQFINNKLPWVVDVENVGVFTVHYYYSALLNKKYRTYIENKLSSENCKKILPYSETSKKSILTTLDCKNFIHKIDVVPNVVKIIKNVQKIPHDHFTILFIGSVQNPDEFYNRGGQELVISFSRMQKKFSNLKLILRSKIPNEFKNILKNKKNVEIYEHPLNFPKFEELFLKSDLFILLGYSGYAMSILEAMNYELPIITTDFLENSDKVINMYNGFKIALGKNTPKFYLPHIPIHFNEKNRPQLDKDFIDEVCDKIQFLYDNNSERIKMGENSKKLVIKEFSLEQKNHKLKKIFDKL